MKLVLRGPEDLQNAIDAYGCPPAARIQKVVTTIMEMAKENEEPECEIHIFIALLPSSYSQVPAMFAKSIERHSAYTSLRSFLKGEYVIIKGSNSEIPGTFRSYVLKGLQDNGRIRVPRKKIPSTYRKRPDLLSRSISATLVQKVRAIKKPKHIIWKTYATKD